MEKIKAMSKKQLRQIKKTQVRKGGRREGGREKEEEDDEKGRK